MKKTILVFLILLTVNAYSKNYVFSSIENQRESKIASEIIKEIYKELGDEVQIEFYPGKRASKVAVSGQVDGEVMRIKKYEDEHSNLIRIPSKIFSVNNTAFFKKENNLNIKSKEDLAGKRVGIIRGVKITEELSEKASVVFRVSNAEQLFGMLVRGRMDVVLTNVLQGEQCINDLELQDEVEYRHILFETDLYHYLHEKNADIVDQVNQKIIEMQKKGKLQKIISEFK